ncbi:MAG: LysR family transcriptional regulator [Solirubrobacterales bacterium]|nr:LysR family transcriptional regulator [Solirubrobacterales bacterium]
MSVELRHLRYFAALAEEMHFGRAAERLHIAQPSLSQQIRKLEGMVGVDLVDRSGRSIELTPAGRALAARTRRTFDDVDAAITAARDAAGGIIGRFAVGFIETAAVSLVPDAVRRFRGTHPRVTLELRELPVRAQAEELIRGYLDLGFVRTEPGHRDLVVERVIEEGFVAALPAGHPLAERERLDPAEVVREPLIVIEREQIPGLYDETVALAREHGTGLEIAQQATSILSILGLVSAGLGVALLPASVRALGFVGIHYVDLDPSPRTAILAVRHRDNSSPQMAPFLAAI